jgi:signal transduction histidine kinase/ligand-binding sensor domain-containing protein
VAAVAVGAALARVSAAQTPVVERRLAHMHHTGWTDRDGLPSSGINATRRSRDGYLWIGASGGLLRFDGVRFVRFDSTNSPALRSRAVGAFVPQLVDRDGVLWISRPDGALVQYRDRTFHEILPANNNTGRISSITEDGLGRLWVNCDRLFIIDRQGATHTPVLPPGVTFEQVQGITPDTANGMWLGTRTGEMWHLAADGTSTRTPVEYSGDSGMRPLLQSRDGTLWILNNGVEYRQRGTWHGLRDPASPNGEVNAVRAVELPDSSVVVASRGHGLLRWRDGRVDRFAEQERLTDAVTRSVLLDEDGSLWVTTDGGLDRLRATPFITLGAADGLPFATPGLLFSDQGGAIWMKDFGHPALFLADGGIIRRDIGPIRFREFVAPPPGRYLVMGTSRRVAQDAWLMDNRLRLLHFTQGRITPYRPVDWPAHVPMRVFEDRRHGLWVAFNGSGGGYGVVRDGRFRRIPDSTSTAASWANRIIEDSLGNIWVARENPSELLRIVDDRIAERFTPAQGTTFEQMLVEGGDTLWATNGEHLARITSGQVSRVTVPGTGATLRGGSVAIQLARGYLWFASDLGIGRVHLDALHRAADGHAADTTQAPHAEWFDTFDGLTSPKLVGGDRSATLRSQDGRLWFATPAGLAVVDPDNMPARPARPRTLIESVVASGQDISLGSPVEIPPHPDRVEIRFTATALHIPDRVRLQYRLDGVDRDWQDVTGPRTTTYTQLRGGAYRFRVRSWMTGDTPGEEVTLALRVLPAWYETWWFVAVVVCAVTGVVVVSVRASLRARTRRAADRMQARFDAELGERTRIARELHDTLLQGFTGITLQLQAVQGQIQQSPAQAADSLEHILTLADGTLREARTMVWDIRAPELGEQDLAAALEGAVRSTINAESIALQFTVLGTRRRLAPSIETALLRIGREAVANAVKHSGATVIRVQLTFAAHEIALSVQDNGCGMNTTIPEPTSDGGRWGVRGMRERAAELDGSLSIASAGGQGTSISVVIPLPAGTARQSR